MDGYDTSTEVMENPEDFQSKQKLLQPGNQLYGAGGVQRSSPKVKPPPRLRTYWWRWWVLLVFVLNQLANNLQWITFAPVADIMRCYYGISNGLVNTLSIASAVITILLVVPASWSLSHYGLRFTILMSSGFTALGGALRIMGAGSMYFSLLMVGQIVSSFSGIIEGSMTLLSETWFSSSERVTATAIAASVAPQIGVLLGYALSPSIMHSEITEAVCFTNQTYTASPSPQQQLKWSETVYQQIFYYILGQALLCILIFFITLIAFPESPPTPPSISRQLESAARAGKFSLSVRLKEFLISIIEFLRNGWFILFLLCTSIHIGSAGAVTSLINEMVLPYFPGEDRMIAYLGIAMKLSSIVGLLITGRFLDWTKAFYWTWVFLYVLTAASMATFAAVVQFQPDTYPLYTVIVFMGAGFSSFQAVALEYSVEMTYPLPEGTSAGFINLTTMTVATILIAVFGKFSDMHQTYIGTWIIVGLLVLGALLSVLVKPELKRVHIDRHQKPK